jgi:L-alanine-DL-glutamate epimerase-like enolase superfamily enzyme
MLRPHAEAYARRVTGRDDLRSTFTLNALTPVDNAAWMLLAAQRGTMRLADLAPPSTRPALAHRNRRVVSVPVVGYGTSVDAIAALVDAGYYVLKIKIGSDPNKDGSQDAMLAADQERLSAIHAAVGERAAPGSPTGRVLYYLDANQRYDGMDRIRRFLDFAERIGALDRIIVLEEPFPEDVKTDVRALPVRVAADESAATDADARERMDLGYGAIALKPVAKTLSMSLRIAEAAHARGIPCLCADLTVPPAMVEWNKTLAAHLAPFPGLDAGMLEANGWQNYANWDAMMARHPAGAAPWAEAHEGAFHLNDDFFETSGGILNL